MAHNQNENGNALFLILIAVVLFAALSYAITQSNRGSGSSAREKHMLSGTVITEFASATKVGVMRLLIQNIRPTNLVFLGPTDAAYGSDAENEVFHPDGGGVGYMTINPEMVETPIPATTRSTQNWYFFNDKSVENIGTAGSDVVMMLSDVKEVICGRINYLIVNDTTIPVASETEADLLAPGGTISDAGSVLNGRAFYCIKPADTNHYIYYHVLAEQ